MSEVKSSPAPEPAKDQEKSTPAQQTVMPDASPGWLLAERACWHLLEKKGEDLVVLDLRGRSPMSAISSCWPPAPATSRSGPWPSGAGQPAGSAGQKPKGVEGLNDGRWDPAGLLRRGGPRLSSPRRATTSSWSGCGATRRLDDRSGLVSTKPEVAAAPPRPQIQPRVPMPAPRTDLQAREAQDHASGSPQKRPAGHGGEVRCL